MTHQGHNGRLTLNNRPYVRIIEQPAKSIRFRYECEGRSAGKLDGEKTTDFQKTFPTIKIENYKGPAFVVISCVSKDPPFYPHPHNLVSVAKQVSKGICSFKTDTQEVGLMHLGIQCVKRKTIQSSIQMRKALGVDPFKTGYDQNPDDIDLYCVRLCFQVFLEGPEKGRFGIPLDPIVSDPIHDKRVRMEPFIEYISHTSAPADGGTEICILCEKALKNDVQVCFFRKENRWETIAELTPPKIYKQVAIVFKSPKYIEPDITEPVTVRIQLRRISDGEKSESVAFQIMPAEKVVRASGKRKRPHGKCAVAKQIQAEASKKVDLINLTSPNPQNSDTPEPWMLPAVAVKKKSGPSKSSKQSKPFIPVVTIRNNELNEMRNQARMRPATMAKELNYNNNAFDYSAEANAYNSQTPQTNAVYQPLHSFNKSQQCQNSTQLNSDTLSDDIWIKDIINTLDPLGPSQPTPSIASKCMDNFVPEPVTTFMPVQHMTAQNTFANNQQIYGIPKEQGQMDQNISELATSITGNLSDINFSDLINVDNMNNGPSGTNVDNMLNGLQNINYLPPLMEGENFAQNINQPIEIPIEALKPPYLLT